MFCKNCGNKIKDNTKFCEECGHSVDSVPVNKGKVETEIQKKKEKSIGDITRSTMKTSTKAWAWIVAIVTFWIGLVVMQSVSYLINYPIGLVGGFLIGLFGIQIPSSSSELAYKLILIISEIIQLILVISIPFLLARKVKNLIWNKKMQSSLSGDCTLK